MINVDDVVWRALGVLAHRPAALVTDVDGTLSRIVPRPEDARVGEVAREALRRLVPRLELVAIVTGREEDVARRMVGVEGVTYVGSYALTNTSLAAGSVAKIAAAKQAIEPFLPRLPGVRLETKDVSFALHFRNSPDPVEARSRILALLEPIAAVADARLMEGKLVVEVAPGSLPDKGDAFVRLMEDGGLRGAIFVGDDLADTAIFRQIKHRRSRGIPGLAVGVVDEETPREVFETTDVQLPGVDGVEAFLTALATRLQPPS